MRRVMRVREALRAGQHLERNRRTGSWWQGGCSLASTPKSMARASTAVILGVGTDLCRVIRIRKSVDGLGAMWIDSVFTSSERDACHASSDPGFAFAQGFAVKEAVSKALGTGFAKGVDPRHVVWRRSDVAEPVVVRDRALKHLASKTPLAHTASIRVSLGGTRALISCLAIIEAVGLTRGAPIARCRAE
ncbi:MULTISPECIES: 4'-phosphopantetheinyl transferase superfamily protein [unclassified Caulobacter]|uniref:holo-ACP synthase n=1 Tax=unclassified Caulobacter TaxID=2648921 RepID=UPI0009E95F7A